MYSKQELGLDLKKQLIRPYDVVRIARWAESIYSDHSRDLSSELDDILMGLSAMEHGPEFEYTETELKLLAEMLISNENNPLEKLNKPKQKETK